MFFLEKSIDQVVPLDTHRPVLWDFLQYRAMYIRIIRYNQVEQINKR